MIIRYTLVAAGLISAFLPCAVRAWGWDVHRLINRTATHHLPADFALFGQWASELESLSIAADERKCCVDGESIKHFIDIDDYPEFFSGQLPHSFQDMVDQYGLSRVEKNGTLPWAIEATYLDLVQRFADRDWNGAIAAAADLGHYVADLHSPLHLTVNYNGQLTGQSGIHSRHESQMTSQHLQELEPAPGSVSPIVDPLDSVFQRIDAQYPGVALVLAADQKAQAAAGNTSSSAYFDALWDEVGEETAVWIRDASLALAGLWYAAWLEAGAPALPGSTISSEADFLSHATQVLPSYPNPFSSHTSIRFRIGREGPGRVAIFDAVGRRVRTWTYPLITSGEHDVGWDGTDDSGIPLANGMYHAIVTDARGAGAHGVLVLLK